ncbi:hypothetical protein C8F04DRAFT_1174723 [Mycena alexandri]|uniref:Fungal N-terminal domain-containing protein n=1 Tax=Mycena alexandri TaxID=1745969 RepID=A0AAD6TEN5_9AGAR|nr:hypothetical protein C8F04DRAFT_1174723 [Mycena alexandri]
MVQLSRILTFLAITFVAIAALVKRSKFQDIVDTLTEIDDIGAQLTANSTVAEATVYMTEIIGKLSIAVDQAKNKRPSQGSYGAHSAISRSTQYLLYIATLPNKRGKSAQITQYWVTAGARLADAVADTPECL